MSKGNMLQDKVAVVTGAGRGIGRDIALMMAAQGAKVVVNDIGASVGGEGNDASHGQQVVNEIKGMGGEAIANGESVSNWEGAQRLINSAIETFGDLHVVVNNAGILRDRDAGTVRDGGGELLQAAKTVGHGWVIDDGCDGKAGSL